MNDSLETLVKRVDRAVKAKRPVADGDTLEHLLEQLTQSWEREQHEHRLVLLWHLVSHSPIELQKKLIEEKPALLDEAFAAHRKFNYYETPLHPYNLNMLREEIKKDLYFHSDAAVTDEQVWRLFLPDIPFPVIRDEPKPKPKPAVVPCATVILECER